MTTSQDLGCLTGVFDADGCSLVKSLPDLDQATQDTMAEKSLVASGQPDVSADEFVQSPVGRIWILRLGATLDLVPAAERIAARAVLRCGQGVLLLAPDIQTKEALRVALLALAATDENSGKLVGHA